MKYVQPNGNLSVYKGETLREKRRTSIMEDNQIINLYFDRSEQAIQETDTKYGDYCYSIAYNILTNQEDEIGRASCRERV